MRLRRRDALRDFGWSAGASSGADFADVQRHVAFAADDDCMHVVGACGVVKHKRGALFAHEPAVAPCGHRRENRVGVASLVGEAVFVTRRVFLILNPTHQSLVAEAGEPSDEDVAADPECCLKVVEFAGSETRLADEDQVPVVAEDRGATSDGAVLRWRTHYAAPINAIESAATNTAASNGYIYTAIS